MSSKFPLIRPLALSIAALTTVAVPVSRGVEMAAGTTARTGLKPPERQPEPVLAPASEEPVKALSRLKLPPGFTASLWAAEPMLANPVAFSIDEHGVAYVAETYRYKTSALDIRNYMFMLEDDLAARTTDDRIAFTKKDFPDDWQKLAIETEVVRRLEDKDGDGKADTTSAFAAEMNTLLDGINSGVLAHRGKVWCTNMPNLWLFTGLTAEGKAEKRESLSFGYGVRYNFTGHDLHGLILGPDGRLYFSMGDRGAHVKTKEGTTIAMPDEGAVFRCEPDGSHLEVFHHGLRNPQELAFDKHGNFFTGDNDCDQGDRERWVYLVEGGDSGWRVGWQHPPLGKDRNAWLAEKMWEPRQPGVTPAHILAPLFNLFDGPSGVAYNPGTGLPAEYDGAFFMANFKGSSARSAISWCSVKESGASFVAAQAPVNFVGEVQVTDVTFGPDSRMYFSDWGEGWDYNGTGRIFRLENAEVEKAQAAQIAEVKELLAEGFAQRSSAELAKLLAHKDQRIRLEAQWALAEKGDGSAAFAAVAKTGADGAEKALSRLHAIWGLGQIARKQGSTAPAAEAATLAPLIALLADADGEVRAQTARVLGDGKVAAARPQLIKGLQDESARVRFFAAMGLAKVPDEQAVAPVLEFLRQNADKDEYLRFAGSRVLEKCDTASFSAAAKDASPSVRIAALLAARRQGKPEVAQFLTDADPLLVKEAARAINDAGIAGGYPQLAKLISQPSRDEMLTLRTINANFRVGTVATAQALADFAASETPSERLRLEALHALEIWPKPPARDRVAGIFRPLAERDGQPAVAALKSVLPKMLGARSPKIGVAAIDAVAALNMKGEAPALLALMSQPAISTAVRGRALEVLAAFNDPKLPEAIKLALTDPEPALRIEASAMLGKLDPEESARQLGAVFASAAPAQKQQILLALGDLPGAAADAALAGILDEARAGKIAPEAQLELLEAAGKRASDEVKTRLSDWIEKQTSTDKLGKYSFALAGGNKAKGETYFKEHAVAQCFRCHKVGSAGGEAGPNLTGVGTRKDRRYLLEAIVEPNATLAHGFESVMCTLTTGDIKAGIIKEETADALILYTPGVDVPAETIRKAEIKARERGMSGMPPGLGELISKRELRDILEYLASLK